MRHPLLAKLALAVGSVLATLAFLTGVELLLRVFDLGSERRYDPFAGFSNLVPMFERETREDGAAVFRTAVARRVAMRDEFLVEKPANGFRAFVVGGSSAAGVPYSYDFSFSGWLRRRLQAELPDRTVEVVNAALPGYASRRLVAVTRELAGYEPDLLIVYSGHNELVERRHYEHLLERDPRLFRLQVALASTRLYRLFSNVLGRDVRDRVPEFRFQGGRALAQMYAAARERLAGVDSARFERELEYAEIHYRFNVEEMIRVAKSAGAQVVLMTLSQNFADWPPGRSRHRPDLSATDRERWEAALAAGDALQAADCEAALAAWQEALQVDPGVAELRWRMAGCQRRLGRMNEARESYRLASDLDAVPYGAPTRHGTLLVDVERELEKRAQDGLVGDELFVDLVHPRLAAHLIIADLIADALAEAEVPAGEQRIRGSFTLPTAAALYRANPDLLIEEKLMLAVACALARRPECAERVTEEVLAEEPGHERALKALSMVRALRGTREEDGGD